MKDHKRMVAISKALQRIAQRVSRIQPNEDAANDYNTLRRLLADTIHAADDVAGSMFPETEDSDQ